MSFVHGVSTVHVLQNMASGHIKVKKGIGHVFYMATPSHATESVDTLFQYHRIPH